MLLAIVKNYEGETLIVGMLLVYLAISLSGIVRQVRLSRDVEFSSDERVIRNAIAPELPDVLVRKLLDVGEWAHIKKGGTMTMSGQVNTYFYVLKYGTAVVTVDDEPVTTINAVSLVGEMSVFTGEVVPATVTATENCVAYAFECDVLREFLTKNGSIRTELERQISKYISSNLNRANRLLIK